MAARRCVSGDGRREQGARVVPSDAPAVEPVSCEPQETGERLTRIDTTLTRMDARLQKLASRVWSTDATLRKIEWLVQQLLATAERREARELRGKGALPEIEALVAQLLRQYDPQALLADIDGLATVLRRRGYPVMASPGAVVGRRSYLRAWQDRSLDPLVRAVSIRLYAQTAHPTPTPAQLRRRVRALEGTLADIDRVQQIWSPDGQSHHEGCPGDVDDLTFCCWFWRRSRALYDRKATAVAAAHTSSAAPKRRPASTKRRTMQRRTTRSRR